MVILVVPAAKLLLCNGTKMRGGNTEISTNIKGFSSFVATDTTYFSGAKLGA